VAILFDWPSRLYCDWCAHHISDLMRSCDECKQGRDMPFPFHLNLTVCISYYGKYLALLAIGQKSHVCFGNLPQKSRMTFKDKPTLENAIFGHFNSRCLELTYIFQTGVRTCIFQYSYQSPHPPRRHQPARPRPERRRRRMYPGTHEEQTFSWIET